MHRRLFAITALVLATTLALTTAPASAGDKKGQKPFRILVTNDDGIDAEGLQALRRALVRIHGIDLAVIAPDGNRSAMARMITTRRPLWVQEVDFGDGPQSAMSLPWGDVVTAWYTTGIPDIEVYMAVPEPVIRRMRRMPPLVPLLGLAPLPRLAAARARRPPPGPAAAAMPC